jgi:hypothetical protein
LDGDRRHDGLAKLPKVRLHTPSAEEVDRTVAEIAAL